MLQNEELIFTSFVSANMDPLKSNIDPPDQLGQCVDLIK